MDQFVNVQLAIDKSQYHRVLWVVDQIYGRIHPTVIFLSV